MAEAITWRQAVGWLRERDSFLILTHIRPDGDTIGCAAGLCAALRKIGKTAYVAENLGVTDTYRCYVQDYCPPADYQHAHLVAVDLATETLLPEEFKPYAGQVELCIDHHMSNTGYAGLLCLEDRAACGEILYLICKELAGELNEAIALPLYVAVSTDTGCFVYGNTTPNCHRVAADLMEYCDPAFKMANHRCFRVKTRGRMALESLLLEGMEFHRGGTVALCSVSLADTRRLNTTEEDAEELASFAGQIEGVKASGTLRELREGYWKLSLRTDYSLDACAVCTRLGGGGHTAASGASFPAADAGEARRIVLGAILAEMGEDGSPCPAES